nr:MAG TPA: hypothetical protein [Caudoviricetes sp.]
MTTRFYLLYQTLGLIYIRNEAKSFFFYNISSKKLLPGHNI